MEAAPANGAVIPTGFTMRAVPHTEAMVQTERTTQLQAQEAARREQEAARQEQEEAQRDRDEVAARGAAAATAKAASEAAAIVLSRQQAPQTPTQPWNTQEDEEAQQARKDRTDDDDLFGDESADGRSIQSVSDDEEMRGAKRGAPGGHNMELRERKRGAGKGSGNRRNGR